jgi:thioredoxin reductase
MAASLEVTIIGGGPAGLSAALMLGRARRSVLLVDDGRERNLSARESHAFLGHDGLSPSDLLTRARVQLDRYPSVQRKADHVDAIDGKIDEFQLQLRSGVVISSRRIVFATGVHDELPEIDGLDTLWGDRIFVCPYCDGWEFRDTRMAVIGNTRTALELAQELWNWSHDLVVCSDKRTLVPDDLDAWRSAANVEVIESHPDIVHRHDGKVIIDCADGERVECDVVFVCAPLKQHSKLPEVLGCEITERGTIKVDEEGRTTIAGCFAAGDCVAKHHQIAFAAAGGARVAIAINDELYMSDAKALVRAEGAARGSRTAF